MYHGISYKSCVHHNIKYNTQYINGPPVSECVRESLSLRYIYLAESKFVFHVNSANTSIL